ncbi:biotin transporter BioY [Paenibacillus abyssi]|uniref:Biotin transporter n=1 Tax=Paenibacillus abyssi TaxID=1340531 RepID=A0A917D5T2_9BACL|nr:biotin transporter BioY [Paenibacillus abyssi]GGG11726.1 BioY family transporter [Paenibacillus abyssi]
MSSPIRSIVFTALFAALFIVMSAIRIPLGFSPVPITLQNFAIMLAGAFLGARYGFLSIFSVCLLTAIGLPLLGGEGGLAKILGPTGGFIWMFPVCALTVGYFSGRIYRSLAKKPVFLFIALSVVFMIFGSLISYVSGVPWLAHAANMTMNKALAVGMYPYLPGDAIKALVAAGVVTALQAYIPKLTSSSASGSTSVGR